MEPKDILLTFIADEDKALKRGVQGHFFPSNHHRITPLVPRARRLLGDAMLQPFYLHLLRHNILPNLKRDEDYAVLRAAYAALTPLLAERFPDSSLRRVDGMFLFGHDDRRTLAAETPETLASYMYYRKVLALVDAYWTLPGMIDKRHRLEPYAADVALCRRIVGTLRATRYGLDDDMFVTRIWFWGLVFIALLNRAHAEEMVAEMTALYPGSEDGMRRLEILRMFLAGAGRADLAGLLEPVPEAP